MKDRFDPNLGKPRGPSSAKRLQLLPKFLCSILVLLACTANGVVLGQSEERKGWGYGFSGFGAIGGCGGSAGVLHLGGGGEYTFVKGFGVGAELGYLTPYQSMGDGLGILNLGAVYAFNRDRKTVPFVTGGYSLFFKPDYDSVNGFFVGGGLNYWIGESWGVRIEGRDQIQSSPGCTEHTLEARIAIVIG